MHGMKFESPLSSIAMSNNNNKMIIGFVDGNLMVRTRKTDSSVVVDNNINDVPSEINNNNQLRFYKGAGLAQVVVEDGGKNIIIIFVIIIMIIIVLYYCYYCYYYYC